MGNATRPGQPITRRSVSEVIQMAMERAGIPCGTAHRIRHWYGSKLVADGTDLPHRAGPPLSHPVRQGFNDLALVTQGSRCPAGPAGLAVLASRAVGALGAGGAGVTRVTGVTGGAGGSNGSGVTGVPGAAEQPGGTARTAGATASA
jgi:hypothetical protein